MGGKINNTYVSSSSQVASGLLSVEVLTHSHATGAGGAIQTYDIATITTNGALGDADVLVVEVSWYFNSGATAVRWSLDTGSGALTGNQLALNATAGNYGYAIMRITKGATASANKISWGAFSNRGSTVDNDSNSSANFDVSAAESFYLKAENSAAKTFGYRMVAYVIKGGA